MVAHVEPVAHLHAVAVHRQRAARQSVDDHQRDELFREVIGTVVVAAIGGQHRQPVGVVVGPHQVVARGLAGRIRAVGLVGMALGEGRRVRGERAVDLVGAHVQEAERGLVVRAQAAPVGSGRFEQAEGAQHVGAHELARAVDAAVHMALGGEVDDGARPVFGQQLVQQDALADVALHEHMPAVAAQAVEVVQVAGVGERVEIDDGLGPADEPVVDEVAADEAGAAGDKEGHLLCFT
jgi:hypothetical protein